jgi:aspartate-semialdehyde dehydrogenase
LSWSATSFNRRKRRLIDAQDDTRKAQVTELHGEAQPVGQPRRCRMMERSVSLNVVTDQLILGVRQRQQAFALGGGQD